MIGVFDSGYGGLSVLRHLRTALPTHDFCYLGDSGRAPYGGRDVHTILDFSEQAVERLFEEGCHLIVVACNTVSCVALRHLQHTYCSSERRILGITIPGAEIATQQSGGHIGIIATQRTVDSGTYVNEIHKLGTHRVTQLATPLLAAIVEEGWEDTDVATAAVARYLQGLKGIDTLLLGCTHYPFLRPALEASIEPGVRVLDPAPFLAERLVDWLSRHPSFDRPGTGALSVLCTGDPTSFAEHGERFLGTPMPRIQHIAEENGRLAHRDRVAGPTGQVTR